MTNKYEAIFRKMLRHIDQIFTYCENKTIEEVAANSMLMEACVFNIHQMGEHVKNLFS